MRLKTPDRRTIHQHLRPALLWRSFGRAHSLVGHIELVIRSRLELWAATSSALVRALTDLIGEDESIFASRPSRAFTSPASMASLSSASAACICSVIVTVGVGTGQSAAISSAPHAPVRSLVADAAETAR
jgi:hypothetical protein